MKLYGISIVLLFYEFVQGKYGCVTETEQAKTVTFTMIDGKCRAGFSNY